MGYAHYWSFKITRNKAKANETAYQSAIAACNKIVKYYSKQYGGLAGYSAHTSEYGGINFNGSREAGHETFILREHFKQNDASNFCKTAEKPYDVVVTACLIVLQAKLGDAVEVASDGNTQNWIAGLQLAQNVLGLKSLKIPSGIRHHKLFAVV